MQRTMDEDNQELQRNATYSVLILGPALKPLLIPEFFLGPKEWTKVVEKNILARCRNGAPMMVVPMVATVVDVLSAKGLGAKVWTKRHWALRHSPKGTGSNLSTHPALMNRSMLALARAKHEIQSGNTQRLSEGSTELTQGQ